VRYLLPSGEGRKADPDHRVPVAWLVFPEYRPESEAVLTPLDKAEALRRLMLGLYPLAGGLDPARIDELIRWIEGVGCFELRLSKLDDGVTLLRDMCR
jgi:hypothetical protein